MKKLLSMILAICILAIGIVPCFAVEDKCDCGEAPIIYVAALGSGSIYLDAGTENERTLFRPEISDILSDFAPLVPAAGELLLEKNYDAFGNVLIECVNKSFGMLALDNEGKSHERVTSEEFHPEAEPVHSLDHNYYFGYDFRLDPIENAKKLRVYVEEVKALTKHDTVRFRASSMGGVVTMSYLKLYGSEDIETIIFQCCPLQGTAVAGELYNGKVEINKDALVNYASDALPSMDGAVLPGILYALVEMLDEGGVWLGLVDIADVIVANLKDRVFDEALIPIFGTMPGIWSFVPHEYYESAKVFMKLDENTHSVLLDKLDFYHYEVQQSAEEILLEAQANGTTIYNVVGYDIQRTPLVTAYRNTSDGTVDTQYASMGATCALIDEYLPDDYQQALYPETNYISPDRKIDASTCILPECTWFIKGMLHSTTHDGHGEMYKVMFSSDHQMTVHEDSRYPQFMQNDITNQTFTRVRPEKTPLEDALWDASHETNFLNITKLLIEFFRSFWKFMIG